MKEIFWNSIAEYNAATWPWQLIFMTVATVLTLILWFRPRTWAKVAMKIYMVTVSLWMAFVYYMTFAASREYSNVMAIFWCLMAASWIYDLVTRFAQGIRQCVDLFATPHTEGQMDISRLQKCLPAVFHVGARHDFQPCPITKRKEITHQPRARIVIHLIGNGAEETEEKRAHGFQIINVHCYMINLHIHVFFDSRRKDKEKRPIKKAFPRNIAKKRW